jgi:hypothetical protein
MDGLDVTDLLPSHIVRPERVSEGHREPDDLLTLQCYEEASRLLLQVPLKDSGEAFCAAIQVQVSEERVVSLVKRWRAPL